MSITKKYKNSPLIEAICEFQFIHKEQSDATIPGMLYDKIKNEFPMKRQRQDFFSLNDMQPEVNMNDLTALTQFYNKAENALVQVGKNILTSNCLKPYPHWEVFKPMILNNLKEYREVSNPTSLRKISLRYINKINVPIKDDFRTSEYFNFYPHKPEGIKEEMNGLDATIHIKHNDARDVLILRIATLIPDDKECISFLLQVEFNMLKPEQLPFERTERWLEEAHTIINNTFESSITDNCRKLLN